MKLYRETQNGSFVIGGMSIPNVEGNRHYRQLMAEAKAGEAEIIPYVEPAPDPNEDLDSQISILESQQTLRRLREAILKPAGKLWLQNIEDQVYSLRAQRV